MADVPKDQQIPSVPPNFREPGSGATAPILMPDTKSEPKEKEQ
jgi:hypothetical protein